MARRFDFYNINTVDDPIWIAVPFPDTDSVEIPAETGVYRFVGAYQGKIQTIFADISTSTAMFGETLRACYFQHFSLRSDGNAELAEMYIINGLHFQHCQCDDSSAVKHKKHIIADSRPPLNLRFKLVISDTPTLNPFDA